MASGGKRGEEGGLALAGEERGITPDEFALLAGHEIAHWYLGHGRSTVAGELAADRLGAQLACRAGFDPEAGLGLFAYLHQGSDHPPRQARVATVMAAGCGAARPASGPS